jgi:AAHS family 4-hydroxybenzoate transporter-like MFS transporter
VRVADVNVVPRQVVDVGEILDRGSWTPYQQWLIALAALTIVFDGIDNQLLGIVIPTVMKEWALPRTSFAPVVSLGYVGMMLGGLAAGLIGDRFGRRVALLASIVIFGSLTLCAAFVDSIAALGALRLLAGIGLGGAMPNAAALAAEYVPKARRALAVTVTIVCVPLGATIAGLVGIRLLPVLGWRTVFELGGAVPLGATLLLAWLLPESPRFLARHPPRWPELIAVLRRLGHPVDRAAGFSDRTEQVASHAPLRTIFAPEYRRDTLALLGSFFSCLFAVYLGFSWLTTLLAKAGFASGVANTGITAFNIGGVVGAIAGGLAIGLVGSRAAMLTMTAGAVVGAAVLSGMAIVPTEPLLPLLAMLTLTGGLINAVQTTMFALAAHVYPTPIRATGVGTAVSIGRIGAICTGYAGPWAIEYRGSASYFALIALSVTVTFISLALVRRHVPARSRQPSAT